MAWNNEITLISRVKTGLDKLHQPLFEEKRLTILCSNRSITRS